MRYNIMLSVICHLQTNKIDFKLIDALPAVAKPAGKRESGKKGVKKDQRRE